jgi:hypothetical protein
MRDRVLWTPLPAAVAADAYRDQAFGRDGYPVPRDNIDCLAPWGFLGAARNDPAGPPWQWAEDREGTEVLRACNTYMQTVHALRDRRTAGLRARLAGARAAGRGDSGDWPLWCGVSPGGAAALAKLRAAATAAGGGSADGAPLAWGRRRRAHASAGWDAGCRRHAAGAAAGEGGRRPASAAALRALGDSVGVALDALKAADRQIDAAAAAHGAGGPPAGPLVVPEAPGGGREWEAQVLAELVAAGHVAMLARGAEHTHSVAGGEDGKLLRGALFSSM